MPRNTILLLEDDADRLAGFKSAVAVVAPSFRLVTWRDANRMIAECHQYLADTALISLDHDLNKELPDSPDPGDGVDVAEFLARLPCICPVILHTSNTERVWSMHNAFRFGGWPAERVIPMGTDWIPRSWQPLCRTLLDKIATSPGEFYQASLPSDAPERHSRALLSLHGLALGDSIGETVFGRPDRAYDRITQDDLPDCRWRHTDDTEMAISIVEVLRLLGTIDHEALARQFAARYERDPDRGYGSGARRILRLMVEGFDWRETSREAFGGQGSLGNGSAMRVAPLGAWFADDLERAAKEARESAIVTHMHPEGVAGAVAIAVAAAMAWRLRGNSSPEAVEEFFQTILQLTPAGDTWNGITRAYEMRALSIQSAGSILGTGYGVTCPDTVPFNIWSAARHLGDYREAIAATASLPGDVDTNCAIVGGIVALSTGWSAFPKTWLQHMEPLPYTPLK